ncbi:glycoside hydrolase family 16 protein [Nocardioides daejeonensis]|uniref:glycoside hydrolase family 16 protein n=1 Tax=Nocardioides daejeonensis TaxID=1046556 RepID=UPI000D74319F|nr:glycoside hydrolase family 16 protein [Nocardioides daejeonensis]
MLKKCVLLLLLALACLLLAPLGPGGLTAQAEPAAPNCGPTLLRSDGAPWECTFADDFNGTGLDRTKWMPQTQGFTSGGPAAWACYVDSPDVIGVADGVLTLRLVRDAQPSPCASHPRAQQTPYRAGSLSTYGLFSQQYGRFEARILNTATDQPGLQESFWLWPDARYSNTSVWPVSGEIDIAETYSRYPEMAIPFLHSSSNLLGGIQGVTTAQCAAQRGVWNTFALEWAPGRMEIFVNGTSCLVNNGGDSAFRKRYIVALTQLIGAKRNAPTAATPLPASMYVDYVRVWQ